MYDIFQKTCLYWHKKHSLDKPGGYSINKTYNPPQEDLPTIEAFWPKKTTDNNGQKVVTKAVPLQSNLIDAKHKLSEEMSLFFIMQAEAISYKEDKR